LAVEKGKAGKSTRRLADKRYLGKVFVGLIGLFAIFLLIFTSLNLRVKGILSVISLVVIIIALLIIKRETDEGMTHFEKLDARASKGANAEEKIGDLLKQLPAEFAVFHDIESPNGNIDHVVLNKSKDIFLLETKSHHGEVTYDGTNLLINSKQTEKNFISQALNNTYWLKEEIRKQTDLNIFIKPIIVFTNAFVKVPKPIKNISIINKKYLIKELTAKGRTIKTMGISQGKVTLFTVLQRLQKSYNNSVKNI
jgi:hypothetical protein